MNSKCILFLCLPLMLARVPGLAQGTAFTYQGRLLDGSQAAQGTYDFQFRLVDAATNGNGVGPALSFASLLVSNGLFETTLDFGAGSFDGSARWLEISVRTNGSLAPRLVLNPCQRLTPSPYAAFAQNAASAGVASGLAGTNLLGGNGGGFTNLNGTGLVAGTVNSNAFDAGTWTLMTNQMNEGSCNLNRWSWQNTMIKLAAGAPIHLLSIGDSMASSMQFYGPLFLAFKNAYGFDGGVGFGAFNLLNSLATAPAWQTNDWNVWFTWFGMVPSGGIYTWTSLANTSVTGNVLEVDYVAEAGGGAFKIQTNINNSGWQDVPGLTNVSANNGGALTSRVIRWTNVHTAPLQLRVVGLSGTVRVISGSIMDFTKPGAILNDFCCNGSSIINFLYLPEAITGPILQSWAPDLIFCKWWDGPSTLAWAGPQFHDFLAKYVPKADLVWVGENPIEGELDVTCTLPLNIAERSMCQQYGWAYFDGYSIFGSFTNGLAHGFLQPNHDPHLTSSGSIFEADALLNWLGLLDNASLGFWNAPGLQKAEGWTGGSFSATGNLDVTGYIAVHGPIGTFVCVGRDGTGNMELFSPTTGQFTVYDWAAGTELLSVINDQSVPAILPYRPGNLGHANQPWLNLFATNGVFYGTVNGNRGFAAGSAVGLTTNLAVVLTNGTTNQLQFTGGILTGIVPR